MHHNTRIAYARFSHGYPWCAVCSCGYVSPGYVQPHAAQAMADAHVADTLTDRS